MRVTGGFLNGLDVTFSEGLNVIIGARGAGKTTLLELIRHAVGAKHADEGQARRHQAFLDAVLGPGEIVVDLETEQGGRHLVVDAKGGGQRADLSNSVLVLGQNELERIASDAASRLNLLDLRTGTAADVPDRTGASELTADLFRLRVEIETLKEESTKRDRLLADKEVLGAQEASILSGGGDELAARREALRAKEQLVIRSTRELEAFGELQQLLPRIVAAQEQQAERLAELHRLTVPLPGVQSVVESISAAQVFSGMLLDEIRPLKSALQNADALTREANLRFREDAAPLRASLEEAETGLGQITSQLRNVETELDALAENDKRIEVAEAKYEEIRKLRAIILDNIEGIEEEQYRTREDLARATTGQISRNVVIVVEHLADVGEFRQVLLDCLKGTGTRVSLIEAVAESILPRQLLEIVETCDSNGLAVAAGIPTERAERLIQHLSREDTLCSLTKVSLRDRVDFRLRDGAVEKSVDTLSTGQKCSVTLPVILSEQHRTLILDQPEDHLDNAYLVEHVVDGITRRSNAQTIIATHNANIPVLGSADTVVVLASDGKTGEVVSSGKFDDGSVVDWITGLMEGGREAFARRSAFYASHGETS